MENLELIVFELVSNGGNAKGLAYEAIACAEKGDFEQADVLLKEANESLVAAHKVQTEMIQAEAAGKHHDVTVLFVHAQDHLMAAIEVCTMAENLIRMNKRLYQLEQKYGQNEI